MRVEPGAFVLKEPLEVGTTWPGEHGGKARIIAVNVTIEVPAGRFSGCVQTLEERLGKREPLRESQRGPLMHGLAAPRKQRADAVLFETRSQAIAPRGFDLIVLEYIEVLPAFHRRRWQPQLFERR